jgi:subtilisin family serine protease
MGNLALLTLPSLATLVALSLLAPAARATDAPAASASAKRSDGLALLRLLGPAAERALAPGSGRPSALFEIPIGQTAAALGAMEVAPGIGRLRGSATELLAFGARNPSVPLEVSPPLHLLNATIGKTVHTAAARITGATGEGVLVGIADTGLDVTHPDFRDESGKTRVAWLLDLSRPILGAHAEVEARFKYADAAGNAFGAVYSGADIDALLADAQQAAQLPQDVNGHGSHVASIAAGNGGLGKYSSSYVGGAPKAKLVIVRLTRSDSGGIETDDLVTATRFIFDRADAEKLPAVANLSLGTDFGPHDGSLLWERAVAANVGPDKPGHVIVAAAGNSGSIEDPVHQSVYVASGTQMKVPVVAPKAVKNGRVQVWVTKPAGAKIDVGLNGPDGVWIAPVAAQGEVGKTGTGYNAGVFQGPGGQSPIPEGTNGAVVVWAGAWPAGEYQITLSGTGVAELYIQAYGEAAGARGSESVRFASGVRSGTINLPASHPDIIGVGCTVSQSRWRSISGIELGPVVPTVDRAGGLPADATREAVPGEVCWFSSAGPNAAGVPKPDIGAPGGGVIAAMSQQAKPGSPVSIFTNENCPRGRSGTTDARCLQVDDRHGVSSGTSMSSPVVAGVAALLLQKDPTLTQSQVRVLLQAGAHAFRGTAAFQSQSGPGEVDAIGALDALTRMSLPSPATSWLSTSVDHLAADASSGATVYLELRTVDGAHGADLFEATRLRPAVFIDNAPVSTPIAIIRRAPGLYTYTFTAPPGQGGHSVTFGATFDGTNVVAPRTLAIATDGWRANYGSRARGACALSGESAFGSWAPLLCLLAALRLRRRRRRL